MGFLPIISTKAIQVIKKSTSGEPPAMLTAEENEPSELHSQPLTSGYNRTWETWQIHMKVKFTPATNTTSAGADVIKKRMHDYLTADQAEGCVIATKEMTLQVQALVVL